jgi:predicted nucleotidyltransferase
LDAFNFAARAGNFNPDGIDADFLVELAPGVKTGLDWYFGAKAALEQLFGRSDDLVEQAAVRNPYVFARIKRNR